MDSEQGFSVKLIDQLDDFVRLNNQLGSILS